MIPVGLDRALQRSRELSLVAATLFWFGLVLALIHVGFQSLAQTLVASHYAEATAATQRSYYLLGVAFYNVNDFYEKAWGVVRGVSLLLYTIAMFKTAAFPRWMNWIGVFGSLELAYRVPTIAANQPSGGSQDIFFTAWLVGVGITMLRFRRRESIDGG